MNIIKPNQDTFDGFRLPYDVFDELLSHCDFRTLALSAAASVATRDTVQNLLLRQFNNRLGFFVDDPVAFRDCLRTTNSVVTGSFATHFIVGRGNCDNWTPADMDICSSASNGTEICSYLVDNEGYTKLELEDCSPEPEPYEASSIKCVITLVKSGRRIDVITSASDLAVYPIFHFHCSAVMNWITADSVFVGYPSLTIAGKAVINPGEVSDRDVPSKASDAIEKYRSRGFDISTLHSHACTESFWNVRTTRSTIDGHSLYFCFAPSQSCGGDVGMDLDSAVFWRLVGPGCTGTTVARAPF